MIPENVIEMAKARMNQEDADGNPYYEYAGNFAIMCLETGEGKEDFDETTRNQCCGILTDEIYQDGFTYVFTFDFGH